jgi:hypothetical protein
VDGNNHQVILMVDDDEDDFFLVKSAIRSFGNQRLNIVNLPKEKDVC